MKALFICEKKDVFENVYGSKTKEKIKELAYTDMNVYTKAEIMSDKSLSKDTEYLFSTWNMPVFTKEEIKEYFPSLRAVFYSAGTVQFFARPFLECKVEVFSAWAANAVPVAEYTVSQIILANKGFFASSRYMSRGEIAKARACAGAYRGNFGAKVGIIGAGMIGKLVINMLKDYKLDVLVFDPFLPDEKAEELGVQKCSLERVFSECAVVSNHLANNEQTKGMLCARLFDTMLPFSTFINTGRGAQVVEDDLVKLLEEREDITAILDVTHPEPPVEGHSFYKLENCILTPHIAGSSGDEVKRMSEYMYNEALLFDRGEKTNYSVSLEMLKTMA